MDAVRATVTAGGHGGRGGSIKSPTAGIVTGEGVMEENKSLFSGLVERESRDRRFSALQAALDAKENAMRTGSVWDAARPGGRGWNNGTSSPPPPIEPAIPVGQYLSMSDPTTQTHVDDIIRTITITDASMLPSQSQFMAAVRCGGVSPSSSFCTTDMLCPVPKALLTKRSKRCSQCSRYVIRTQANPSAPFRLNKAAISTLPTFYLVSALPVGAAVEKKPGVLSGAALDVRFPPASAGMTLNVELELVNVLEQTPITLQFVFSKSDPEDTLEILSPDLETTLPGYDEFAEEETGSSADLSEEAQAHPCIIRRKAHKVTLRLEARVRPHGDEIGAASRCSFDMCMTTPSMTQPMLTHPVFFLGYLARAPS